MMSGANPWSARNAVERSYRCSSRSGARTVVRNEKSKAVIALRFITALPGQAKLPDIKEYERKTGKINHNKTNSANAEAGMAGFYR